jgi:dolichol-phosphate mannosyltransferase
MPDPQPNVSIVVPTYNESENLTLLAERVFGTLPSASTELLIVDDNSPDHTALAARELAGRFPIRCLVRTTDRGLAPAVVHGLQQSRGRVAVVMDADLSHPPESIPALLKCLDDPQTQMAIGSRFVRGGRVDLHWPTHRRVISLLGRLLARPLTPVRDMVAGFFAVRPAEIDFDRLSPIGYKIALELIVRQSWTRVVEVPITFTDRHAGRTKLTAAEQLRYLRHLGRLYWWVMFGDRAPTAARPDGSGS